MTQVIAPNGAVTGYEYDTRGNLISTLGPTGNLTIYAYDILDRVQILEQSLTAPVSYVYDELGRVIEVKQGDKHTITTYDKVGNTLAVQNPLGNVMKYGYDRDNRMTNTVTYAGHVTKTGYDAAGNVISVVDALGSESRFGYNSDGMLTNQFDALGHETQYRYDLAGNLIGVKDPLDHITSYGYDVMGNMTSMLTPDGHETTYSYDLHDNMTSITSPSGEVEQFIYDVESRLEKSIRPDGSAIVYDYDKMDQLLSKTYSDNTQQVLYAYDLAGNRISMNDATGEYTYTYDVLGRLKTVTDSAGRVVAYHYDEYGRTSQIDYPEGRSISYGYDLNDNLLTVTDSIGQSVSYTYDKDGNPLTCERSNGIVTSYTYDAVGNVLSVINECGGQVMSSFVYTYDANGQILTEDAVQGEDVSRKEFTYDEAGQLDGYTEDLNGEFSETSFFYNPDGSRVSVTTGVDGEAVVSEYDDNGRLTKQTTADGVTDFVFDANGNLVEKRGVDQVISYAYDIENRLEAVREGGALLMAATYDGDGNRVFQVNRQETTVILEKSNYGTDPILPVGQSGAANGSSVEKGNNGGVSVDDSEDRIPGISQEDLVPLPGTDATQQPDVHTYYEKVYVDPADSIFWYGFGQGFLQFLANMNSALAAYLSDWFCHLWDFVTGQYELVLHSEAVYSQEDLEILEQLGLEEETLTELESGMVTVAGGNDAYRGSNTGSRPKPDSGTQSEGLQNPGNIIAIPETPDQVTRIDYDLSYYVNDINTANVQVLMTYGRNSEEKAVYTYGFQRIAEDDLQTATYSDYLCDGRGSVSQTVVAGAVDLSLRYDAYGCIVSEVSVNFVGFAFNGEESNALTGLQYLRARYYDTELGSFLTADSYLGSATNPLSRNRYTYAENDPVNNFDPSGHYSIGNRGVEKYMTGNSLNELRDFATAAALYAGEVNARNSFNGSIARANGTEMSNYASISGISQATANYYINQGIAKAGEASMNYGCSVPTVPNEAVAKLQYNVNASRNSANAQIQQIKANKQADYNAYLEDLKRAAAEQMQNPFAPNTIGYRVWEARLNGTPIVIDGLEGQLGLFNRPPYTAPGIQRIQWNDIFGADWKQFEDEFFITDTTVQAFVNNDVLSILHTYARNDVMRMVRPNNIGKGTWAKLINKELDAMDDWLGPASKAAKFSKWVPGISLGIDMSIGAYENFQQEAGFISVVLPVEELAIIRQPVSVEGNLGENAVFTVEATGEGLTYQWFYSQEEGEWYESAATGFDTATLTVQLLAYRDGQKYRCEITDANGETLTTDEVTMTIRKSIVEITSQPVGVTNAVLGQTYTYTVEATGESLTYLWEYSANGGETWQQTWLEGYNTATLTVAMNSNRDGNLYRCVVSSMTDQKTSEAAILSLPQFSAEIITQPVDVAAGTGETISFTVEAEGEDLSFTWYRSKNNGETWEQTWLNGYNTNTLSFVANESRCGMYKCLVKDVSGKGEYTEAVTLSMKKGEPELQITQHPAEQTSLLLNQTVTFTVEAVGEGLTYAWYRSDDNGETWVRTWMDGYNEETLTFAATEARQDLYRCVVTDLYGNTVTSQSAEFKLKESTLQIVKQPEDVTIAKAGDTVTFTVEATGEGLTYCWYASTDGETWTQTWLTGYNTANLSFAGTAGRIAKQYKCVITDETGNTVETNAVKATVG